jgi:hypothetical protein
VVTELLSFKDLDAAVQQARTAGVDSQAEARTGNLPYALIIAAAQAM